MFFTLAGNRRRIEDAAAKARAEGIAMGRQEGIAMGREEVRQEIRRQAIQELADWYKAAVEWHEACIEDLAAGRDPGIGRDPGPPPLLLENSGNNAPY